MAQIGCFVPADSAKIGLVDKIFTRVGASDNISLGESTFMVEMNEAANILNNLSDRSLILLMNWDAAPAPTTASPLPGPSWNISTNIRAPEPKRSSPPTTTN